MKVHPDCRLRLPWGGRALHCERYEREPGSDDELVRLAPRYRSASVMLHAGEGVAQEVSELRAVRLGRLGLFACDRVWRHQAS